MNNFNLLKTKSCVVQSSSKPQIVCNFENKLISYSISTSYSQISLQGLDFYYNHFDDHTHITELTYSDRLERIFGIGIDAGIRKFCKFKKMLLESSNEVPESKIKLKNIDGQQTGNLTKYVIDDMNDKMIGYLKFSSTYNFCVYAGVLTTNVMGTVNAETCLSSSFNHPPDDINLKYLSGQQKAVIYFFSEKVIKIWDITKATLDVGISVVPSPDLPGVPKPYNYSKTIEVFTNYGSNVILLGINNLLYGFRVTQSEVRAWAPFPKGNYD